MPLLQISGRTSAYLSTKIKAQKVNHSFIMYNPFEELTTRLVRLETLITERLPIGNGAPAMPEIGGLELAQDITKLSKARIYALVSARALPHSKRGNKLYFSRAELLAWVAAGSRAEYHSVNR
jgi:hypothetical protein